MSEEDCDQIWDEYDQYKDFWDAFKAAGCVKGFALDRDEERLAEEGEFAAAKADSKPPDADMAVDSSATSPLHRGGVPDLPF